MRDVLVFCYDAAMSRLRRRRVVLAALALAACGETAPEPAAVTPDPGCAALFGQPSRNTGLSADQCRPTCTCGGQTFTPPAYTEAELLALEARVLIDPPEPPASDPYETPAAFPERPSAVCAVLSDDAVALGYRLQTFEDEPTAAAAGAQLTHHGACGLCSSLADLTVYLRRSDLTTPVRDCGLRGFKEGDEANLQCLRDVGFTPACAAIWFYNTRHTRTECLSECLAHLNKPHHLDDGGLNPCIQCDEDKSGAVFKAVAGRTRRNSGVPTALCRPCDSVSAVIHRYEP
jgi:hypothetical protein